jgi:hypothetical protein
LGRRVSRATLANRCLDAYVDLAILEERIEGRLPAIEGIRIMKVRKTAVPALPSANPAQIG